jgi:MerR family mercuric resistance operon transcriptional regulator
MTGSRRCRRRGCGAQRRTPGGDRGAADRLNAWARLRYAISCARWPTAKQRRTRPCLIQRWRDYGAVTISELAKGAGVSVETIRYYQRISLLRTPNRPRRGFRAYDTADASHLQFVRKAQALGFTLDEVRVLLDLTSADCDNVERLAGERLISVRTKIAELRRLERALAGAVRQCRLRRPYDGCPLIVALSAASTSTPAARPRRARRRTP